MRNAYLAATLIFLTCMSGCGGGENTPVPAIDLSQPSPPHLTIKIVEVNATSAKAVLTSPEEVFYRIRLDNGNYSLSERVSGGEPYVWTFHMLAPETSYVVTAEATNAAGTSAFEYDSFTAAAAMPGAALFTSVETTFEPTKNGFVQKTAYTLTTPARVFLYEKYALTDSWGLVAYTVSKDDGSYFPVGDFLAGQRVFFRLVAENDADEITDSYESSFTAPQ